MALIWAISSFHWSTLEEYYIGGLFLGPGNGVSDGSAFIFSIHVFMGIFGNAWTKNKVVGDLQWCEIFAYGIALSNMIIVFLCIKGIVAHSYKEIKEGEITGE